MPIFEQLITGWKEQGYELVSLRQYLDSLEETLPRNEMVTGTIEGRSGTLAMQGK
jgi:hypothetical protein